MGPQKLVREARLILVGDASRFLVFEKRKGKRLKLIDSFSNSAAKKRVSELTTDLPGRAFASFSRAVAGGHPIKHAYTRQQDPKSHELEKFVREVSASLSRAPSRSSLRIILVAKSPLSSQLKRLIQRSFKGVRVDVYSKDLAWLTGAQLESRVDELVTEIAS